MAEDDDATNRTKGGTRGGTKGETKNEGKKGTKKGGKNGATGDSDVGGRVPLGITYLDDDDDDDDDDGNNGNDGEDAYFSSYSAEFGVVEDDGNVWAKCRS